MAVSTTTRHLCLFFFLPSLLFLAHGRLLLDPSDYTALSLVQNDLSINGQRLPSNFAERPNLNSRKQERAAGPNSQRDDNSNAPAPVPASAIAKHHKSSKRRVLGWILGFLVGPLAGNLSGFVFSVMFKLIFAAFRGGQQSVPVIYSQIIKRAEDLAFLEKDDAFTLLEMIGRGGCGEVYKAELPGSNGKMIAVKKIIQPPKEGDIVEEDSKLLNKKMRQIKSEINTVGQIRHRNLLPLLAHLSRPDCHLLVYEFMKNGSLQHMLKAVSRGERELDWLTRHRIAIGIASGLEYLHLSNNPRIIHLDLKPDNVLIDDDMEARITDFGLAKSMPDAQTHVTTSNVAGTFGYIAPEYYQTQKFTDKCDIYSFGILLGVLVMGKFPTDDFFYTNQTTLIRWMRDVMISDNPTQAIDQKLIGNGFEEQMVLVLKIACFCTLDNPKKRPNSKDTRCMLSQIKH